MIHRVVQFAVRNRFLVFMLTVLLVIAGTVAFQRMPVDAYPDPSPTSFTRTGTPLLLPTITFPMSV